MALIRTSLIPLFLVLFYCGANADPSNVMVGDLTFNRPEQWKWIAPAEGSAATTRFLIAHETANRAGCEVRFYLTDRKPKSSIEGWKSYFPDPGDRAKATEERKEVKGRRVIWFTIRGTYAYPKTPARSDYLFVAVMISQGEQFIMVRLSGLEADAGKALPLFTSMIENALEEAP